MSLQWSFSKIKWKRAGLKQVSKQSVQEKAVVSDGLKSASWQNQNRGEKKTYMAGVENGIKRRHHLEGAGESLESSDYKKALVVEAEDWSLMPSASLGNLFCILQFSPSNSAWQFPNLSLKMLNPGIHHATAWACHLPLLPFITGKKSCIWVALRVSWLCWKQGQLKILYKLHEFQRIDLYSFYYSELGNSRGQFCLVAGRWIESSRGDNQKWGPDIPLEP